MSFQDPQNPGIIIPFADLTSAEIIFLTELAQDGVLNLPTTTSTRGQIQQNSVRIMHMYGTRNMFLGNGAANFTLTGTDNYSLGTGALVSLSSGVGNIGIGTDALATVSTGGGHVGIGLNALKLFNRTSSGTYENSSVALGPNALASATNGRNVAIGPYTLPNATTGADLNFCMGRDGLEFLTTGVGNVCFGEQIGSNSVAVTTESFNILVGYRLGMPEAGVNSQLNIGNLIYAKGGFGTDNNVGAGFVGIGVHGGVSGGILGRLHTRGSTSDNTANAFYATKSDNTFIFSIRNDGRVAVTKTITAAGTTGARTIHMVTGSVNFAAGATSLVVTNNLVTTDSTIFLTPVTDANSPKVSYTPNNGSFQIDLDIGPAAEMRVDFFVLN